MFENVTKTYGTGPDAFTAIKNVTFTIEDYPGRGELVSILGPSGCGKSTVIRLIAALQPQFPQTSGKILVDGKTIHGPGPDRGMVFQDYTSFDNRSVLDNVAFGLECRGVIECELASATARRRSQATSPTLTVKTTVAAPPRQADRHAGDDRGRPRQELQRRGDRCSRSPKIADGVHRRTSTPPTRQMPAPTTIERWQGVSVNVPSAVPARRSGYDHARYWIEKVGLSATRDADKYPHELSGGMRQRVAIARTLILQPKIILMDEPFGALDPPTRTRMQDNLVELWREQSPTIFFITHSVEEAVFLGDHILLFSSSPGTVLKTIRVPPPDRPSIAMQRDPHFQQIVTEIRDTIDKLESSQSSGGLSAATRAEAPASSATSRKRSCSAGTS